MKHQQNSKPFTGKEREIERERERKKENETKQKNCAKQPQALPKTTIYIYTYIYRFLRCHKHLSTLAPPLKASGNGSQEHASAEERLAFSSMAERLLRKQPPGAVHVRVCLVWMGFLVRFFYVFFWVWFGLLLIGLFVVFDLHGLIIWVILLVIFRF